MTQHHRGTPHPGQPGHPEGNRPAQNARKATPGSVLSRNYQTSQQAQDFLGLGQELESEGRPATPSQLLGQEPFQAPPADEGSWLVDPSDEDFALHRGPAPEPQGFDDLDADDLDEEPDEGELDGASGGITAAWREPEAAPSGRGKLVGMAAGLVVVGMLLVAGVKLMVLSPKSEEAAPEPLAAQENPVPRAYEDLAAPAVEPGLASSEPERLGFDASGQASVLPARADLAPPPAQPGQDARAAFESARGDAPPVWFDPTLDTSGPPETGYGFEEPALDAGPGAGRSLQGSLEPSAQEGTLVAPGLVTPSEGLAEGDGPAEAEPVGELALVTEPTEATEATGTQGEPAATLDEEAAAALVAVAVEDAGEVEVQDGSEPVEATPEPVAAYESEDFGFLPLSQFAQRMRASETPAVDAGEAPEPSEEVVDLAQADATPAPELATEPAPASAVDASEPLEPGEEVVELAQADATPVLELAAEQAPTSEVDASEPLEPDEQVVELAQADTTPVLELVDEAAPTSQVDASEPLDPGDEVVELAQARTAPALELVPEVAPMPEVDTSEPLEPAEQVVELAAADRAPPVELAPPPAGSSGNQERPSGILADLMPPPVAEGPAPDGGPEAPRPVTIEPAFEVAVVSPGDGAATASIFGPLAPADPGARPANTGGESALAAHLASRETRTSALRVEEVLTAPTRDNSNLRQATSRDLSGVWNETSVPLEHVGHPTKVLTPNVGRVRVVLKTNDIFEGRLYAVGENNVWIEGPYGRMGITGARVARVEQLDTASGTPPADGAGQQGLVGTTRVRVKTPGGTLLGKVISHDSQTTTLVTDDGARITLPSKDVEFLADTPRISIRSAERRPEGGGKP